MSWIGFEEGPMSRGGWDVAEGKPEDAELPNGHTVPGWAEAAREPESVLTGPGLRAEAKAAWWKAQSEIEKLRGALGDKGRP